MVAHLMFAAGGIGMSWNIRRTGLAVLLTLGAVTATAAEPPGALITDYSGKASPVLSVYSELPEGMDFKLGAADSITLLHYGSCRSVTVTGGKIHVGAQKLEVAGGKAVEAPGDNCPRKITIATAGVGGGVLMRGMSMATLPSDMNCVVIGTRRAEVARVEIADKDGQVALFPVTAGRTAALSDTPALVKKDYGLSVVATDGQVIKRMPISVDDAKSDRMCLIRVD